MKLYRQVLSFLCLFSPPVTCPLCSSDTHEEQSGYVQPFGEVDMNSHTSQSATFSSGRIVKHLHCGSRLGEITEQKGKIYFPFNEAYSLLSIYSGSELMFNAPKYLRRVGFNETPSELPQFSKSTKLFKLGFNPITIYTHFSFQFSVSTSHGTEVCRIVSALVLI